MSEVCLHHSGLIAQMEALCKKMELVEKGIEKQIQMQEKAIFVAKGEMERRLESMNEFISQLSNQALTFISKTEVDLKLKEIDTKFSPLLTLSNERKGSKKWEDHIIEVLIGIAVIVIVWLMKGGVR